MQLIVANRVHFVEKITRGRERTFRSSSLSGHLIHFVVEGEVEQESNGEYQKLTPQHAVWYEPNSMVRGKIMKSPWTFYTVSFDSPNLPYIAQGKRVVKLPMGTQEHFEQLYQMWKSESPMELHKNLQFTSLLYKVIGYCFPNVSEGLLDCALGSWWDIEMKFVKSMGDGARSISDLAQEAGLTMKALAKICKEASGETPKSRLNIVRMAHVKGLLLSSNHTVSEVADLTGFKRVQDLSRNCKDFFGMTPTELRASDLDFAELPEQIDSI